MRSQETIPRNRRPCNRCNGYDDEPAMPPPVIEFDHVCVGPAHRRILSDVSFRVEAGERVCLCGKSGAGKSTVLAALMGFRPPDAGVIRFRGAPIDRHNIADVRRALAFVHQEPVLGGETVGEALEMPFRFRANRRPPSPAERRAALERVRLPADLDRPVAVLSGGEKQRLALTRVMLLGRTVYVTDEISSALDAESKTIVYDLLDRPENTIISVSHDPEWMHRCSRVLAIAEGTLTPSAP